MQQVQFYLKGPQGMATVTADMVKDTGRSPPPPYSAMRVQYYHWYHYTRQAIAHTYPLKDRT